MSSIKQFNKNSLTFPLEPGVSLFLKLSERPPPHHCTPLVGDSCVQKAVLELLFMQDNFSVTMILGWMERLLGCWARQHEDSGEAYGSAQRVKLLQLPSVSVLLTHQLGHHIVLIPTSPGYELDPNLQGIVGQLSLTFLSAGPQPFCSGRLARPTTTLPCCITSR